jgi:hypothetical protein
VLRVNERTANLTGNATPPTKSAFGAGSGGRSTMLVANAMYMFGKQRLNASRTMLQGDAERRWHS